MRKQPSYEIEKCRIAGPPGKMEGMFSIRDHDTGDRLRVIVSDGSGWEERPDARVIAEKVGCLPAEIREKSAEYVKRLEELDEFDRSKPWEHVSVSKHNGLLPTWRQMCWIKSLFWEDEECVIQYHPPKSRYVNVHPGVLHMWRPVAETIPMPPIECV